MAERLILTLDQLRSLIGLFVYHQGVCCQVIEVLEDGPAIVLLSEEPPTIQPNQHGEATRRTPVTYTIPVLNAEQDELHPAFLALDLADL